MATAFATTHRHDDVRAMRILVLGSSLRSEAAELVEDLNASYGLVHEVVTEALRAPESTPIDIENMRAKLHTCAQRMRS